MSRKTPFSIFLTAEVEKYGRVSWQGSLNLWFANHYKALAYRSDLYIFRLVSGICPILQFVLRKLALSDLR